jgi:hypothetical protein
LIEESLVHEGPAGKLNAQANFTGQENSRGLVLRMYLITTS